MSLVPSMWGSGRSEASYKDIPESDKCEKCGGSGEEMTCHRFGKGYGHVPCFKCGGSGCKLEKS